MKVLFFTVVMLVASTSYAGEQQKIVNGTGTACSKVESANDSGIKLVSEETILDTSKTDDQDHLIQLAKTAKNLGANFCFKMENWQIKQIYIPYSVK